MAGPPGIVNPTMVVLDPEDGAAPSSECINRDDIDWVINGARPTLLASKRLLLRVPDSGPDEIGPGLIVCRLSLNRAQPSFCPKILSRK